jgi:hypothetical protein
VSRYNGMLIERARQNVEHALEAIGAGQYGEAWLALKDAMRKLEQAEEDGAPEPACPPSPGAIPEGLRP